MSIVAIVATKGGVGKSTTAVALACALQDAGEDVAVLDTDPQATAARWMPGLVQPLRPTCAADVMAAAALAAPALVIVDTPPGASDEAVAAMEAAHVIVAVTRLGPADLAGLNQLSRMVQPDLIVPTQWDRRRALHAEALELLRESFGDRVVGAIPAAAIVERAQGAGERVPALSPVGLAYAAAANRLTYLLKGVSTHGQAHPEKPVRRITSSRQR